MEGRLMLGFTDGTKVLILIIMEDTHGVQLKNKN